MSSRAVVNNSRTAVLTRTLYVLTAGALAMASLLSLLSSTGHDQLWFLLLARRWLAGATLYGPEAFDSNPPAIIWLSAIPDRLGAALPVPVHDPATAWAKLLLVLLMAAVVLLARPLLRRAVPALPAFGRALLLFAFVVALGVLPARDFGQRDALAGLLCIPYVLAAAALSVTPDQTAPPRRELLTTSTFLAAIGLCFKPQQTVLVLATEAALLLLWWRDRRTASRVPETNNAREARRPRTGRGHLPRSPLRRLTPWTLLLCGAIYCLAIRLFSPAYLSLALPLLRQTYWAISHLTTIDLIREAPQLHLLAVITLVLFIWQSRAARIATAAAAASPQVTPQSPRSIEPSPNRTTAIILAAGLGSLLAYHLQATGWYYQQLPALMFFTLALALELLSPLSRVRSVPRHLPALAGALSLLAITLTAWFSRDELLAPRGIELLSPDPVLFSTAHPGTPVAILTTSVEDSMMPVERLGLALAQRTNNLWLLPAVLRSEDPDAAAAPARTRPRHLTPQQVTTLDFLVHRWMVEDLARWHPALVLVARCQDLAVHCQELEDRHDDLLAWFSRDPAFRTIWSQYRLTRTSGSYDAYTRTTTGPSPQ